ncbi:unnamed protein product [Lathyrus sativus]|nr:unnamed protein product [Lathyrus sativus]
MKPHLRTSIMIFLLLFVELYPATVHSLRIIKRTEMKGRELMKVDMDDYKEYDSNHKNDQGKGKPHGLT